MKYGIYYAFWEHEWKGDFIPHIKKVSKLGFDVLEVACGDLVNQPDSYCRDMSDNADDAAMDTLAKDSLNYLKQCLEV